MSRHETRYLVNSKLWNHKPDPDRIRNAPDTRILIPTTPKVKAHEFSSMPLEKVAGQECGSGWYECFKLLIALMHRRLIAPQANQPGPIPGYLSIDFVPSLVLRAVMLEAKLICTPSQNAHTISVLSSFSTCRPTSNPGVRILYSR